MERTRVLDSMFCVVYMNDARVIVRTAPLRCAVAFSVYSP